MCEIIVIGTIEENYRYLLFRVARHDSAALLLVKEETYRSSPNEPRRIIGPDADIFPTAIVFDVYSSSCVPDPKRVCNMKVLVGNFCMHDGGKREFAWKEPSMQKMFSDAYGWMTVMELWGLSVGLKKVISNPFEDPTKLPAQFPNFHRC